MGCAALATAISRGRELGGHRRGGKGADQLSSLFENLNLGFTFDIVYVMVHMLFFMAQNTFNSKALNDEKRKKICRACICGTLVSDMNKVRPNIVDKGIPFRDKRLYVLEVIEKNRKKKKEAQQLEAQNKEEGEQQGEDENPRRSTRAKIKK
ncbi:hypothetical protein RDABS01_004621 [Bienertia sinuspersici]